MEKTVQNNHVWPRLGQNELECGTADMMLISLTLALHHILTYLPASPRYFMCAFVKFPKGDLSSYQISFPLICRNAYHSSLSLKDQLKFHLLQKAFPYSLRATLISVFSSLWFFQIIYLYLFCEVIILTSPPELLGSCLFPNLVLWDILKDPSKIFLFSYITRVNL